jgi:SAM-dependent methyltransferase
MRYATNGEGVPPVARPGGGSELYGQDYWRTENLKFVKPHIRLEKVARIVNRMARGADCDLLDVGCGPATLRDWLHDGVRYHGIDIAIHEPTPTLLELDFLHSPIDFHGKKFDIIVAQGIFEYMSDQELTKMREISDLLAPGGSLIVSYWNFDHRRTHTSEAINNVRSISKFHRDLASCFNVTKFYPVSYNWKHGMPSRRLVKSLNIHVNVNIPVLSRILGVEYFFICSPLGPRG